MVIIQQTLVSEDLLSLEFSCDLFRCNGACCVEGDAGAPLEKPEIAAIEQAREAVRPFVSPAGLEVLRTDGFHTTDAFGVPVTTLIDRKECVYTIFEKGIAFCALERAFLEGKSSFRKPVSCHLYPIRITRVGDYEALNVHQWNVCASCWKASKGSGKMLYESLREALERKFGAAWYAELVQTAQAWRECSGKLFGEG